MPSVFVLVEDAGRQAAVLMPRDVIVSVQARSVLPPPEPEPHLAVRADGRIVFATDTPDGAQRVAIA